MRRSKEKRAIDRIQAILVTLNHIIDHPVIVPVTFHQDRYTEALEMIKRAIKGNFSAKEVEEWKKKNLTYLRSL